MGEACATPPTRGGAARRRCWCWRAPTPALARREPVDLAGRRAARGRAARARPRPSSSTVRVRPRARRRARATAALLERAGGQPGRERRPLQRARRLGRRADVHARRRRRGGRRRQQRRRRSPAERCRAAARAVRAPRRAAATAPGAGLGLSIVRSVAEAHGGALELEPRPGGGLRVTVRLPATWSEATPGPAPSSNAADPAGRRPDGGTSRPPLLEADPVIAGGRPALLLLLLAGGAQVGVQRGDAGQRDAEQREPGTQSTRDAGTADRVDGGPGHRSTGKRASLKRGSRQAATGRQGDSQPCASPGSAGTVAASRRARRARGPRTWRTTSITPASSSARPRPTASPLIGSSSKAWPPM